MFVHLKSGITITAKNFINVPATTWIFDRCILLSRKGKIMTVLQVMNGSVEDNTGHEDTVKIQRFRLFSCLIVHGLTDN